MSEYVPQSPFVLGAISYLREREILRKSDKIPTLWPGFQGYQLMWARPGYLPPDVEEFHALENQYKGFRGRVHKALQRAVQVEGMLDKCDDYFDRVPMFSRYWKDPKHTPPIPSRVTPAEVRAGSSLDFSLDYQQGVVRASTLFYTYLPSNWADTLYDQWASAICGGKGLVWTQGDLVKRDKDDAPVKDKSGNETLVNLGGSTRYYRNVTFSGVHFTSGLKRATFGSGVVFESCTFDDAWEGIRGLSGAQFTDDCTYPKGWDKEKFIKAASK